MPMNPLATIHLAINLLACFLASTLLFVKGAIMAGEHYADNEEKVLKGYLMSLIGAVGAWIMMTSLNLLWAYSTQSL
jgi:hypothetical protein